MPTKPFSPLPRHALASLALLCATAHAAPTPTPPVSTRAEPLLAYTVTAHDTLIGLGRTLFTEPGAWKEIARLNHLSDSNRIRTGQVLMVPARYLQSKVVPARLVSAFGDVRIAGQPAQAGATFNVGDSIRTGDSSTAVVLLADGSRVKLAPDTEGRLDEQRRFRIKATAAAIDDGLVAASLRLLSGSIEVLASKVLRARPLEVSTPTAVIGVRGTSYRVRNDVTPAADGAPAIDSSATEVLEGKVHAQVGEQAAQSADVPANFGAPLEAGKTPQVLPLPAAPDLSALPASLDRLPVRLPIGGDLPLRVQVANDAAFDHIQFDLRVPAGDDVRLAGLADGPWHLRVRRISPEGLEGLDGTHAFELHARPQAPFTMEPAGGAKRPVGDVVLRWSRNPEAVAYAVDVARDADFTRLALQENALAAEQVTFHPLGTDFGAADGVYYWRVRSLDAAGHHGAWSDMQAFVLRPTPRAPLGTVSPDGAAIELSWGGNPSDRVEVELAGDAQYAQLLSRGEFQAAGVRLPRPAGDVLFAHYRFIEPDGFTTAWSDSVRIVVDDRRGR